MSSKQKTLSALFSAAASLTTIAISVPGEAQATSGCDQKTWVGVRRHNYQSCPVIRGSAAGEWFTQDPFAVNGGQNRATEMCTYIWTPGTHASPSPSQLQSLMNLAIGQASPLTRLNESCRNMSSMSQYISEGLIPLAHEAFMLQTDRVLPLPTGSTQPTRVNIALVDSLPDYHDIWLSPIDHHSHGRALGMLIRDLACPDTSNCPITLRTHLAFGRRDECKNCEPHDLGDYSGRRSELAMAINDAVARWRFHAGNERLIINLSLGWAESVSALEDPQNLPADSLAVLNALKEAHCRGVLIFAASGNTANGPAPSSGPLFPGAWEQRPSPSDAECASEFGITTGPLVREEGSPLLFSVGGVDGADRPLFNGRPGSRPRLAAPAEHLSQSYSEVNYPDYRATLSGSSVSTAVATAAAAVAWSYKYTRRGSEVADLLYSSGEALLGDYADFCPGIASCDEIHRISVCGAIQAACAEGQEYCPSLVECVRRPAFSDYQALATHDALRDAEKYLVKIYSVPTDTMYRPECGADVTAPIGGTDLPCPDMIYPNALDEPANSPQPPVTPCRMCALTQTGANGYKLFVGINSALLPGTAVSNASLEISYPNGTKRFYNLPLGTLYPGNELQYVMDIYPSGFSKAVISFLVYSSGGTHSSRDPLMLD